MSRKENLKKSLGISEYPWSSDDDENTTAAPSPSAQMSRRLPEPRTSTSDMPGTSGLQPPPASPASARKQQARMDRALFWSIINNTPRPSAVGETRSNPVRLSNVPLSCVSRPTLMRPSDATSSVRVPRRDQPSSRTDIQRLLAFKKLTRSLHNYAQRQPNSNLYYPTSSRSGSGSSNPSRNTLFNSTSVSNLMSSLPVSGRGNRGSADASRFQIPRTSLPTYGQNRNVSPSLSSPIAESSPVPTTSRARSHSRQSREPHSPEPYVAVDQSEDEIEANVQSASMSTVESREENQAQHENEVTHNQSTSLSLEEVIVEVDGPDEQEMQEDIPAPDVTTEDNAAASNNDSSDVPAVVNNSENAADVLPPTSPYLGVKRKRDANGENAEPYSVQEFNQNLLRLLECPVCLEWMEPPISQCRRGHLVCSRCRARLASCPVCRTTFSSVRNRAMEGVAEMLRYPCRHGCGREVRLRRRAPHEASCAARRYHCPAPACARLPPLPHRDLAHHVQSKHLQILKIGQKHKFSMKVNSEQHDTWLIMALDEFFHLRVDVDIRTWGVIVYVAYIGPKRKAQYFTYEVTVEGQHNARKLVYARTTHSDLESSNLNVSRQDCFHLTLDQALNFLRFKNRHCEPDKFLDFEVEITKWATGEESKDDSDS